MVPSRRWYELTAVNIQVHDSFGRRLRSHSVQESLGAPGALVGLAPTCTGLTGNFDPFDQNQTRIRAQVFLLQASASTEDYFINIPLHP